MRTKFILGLVVVLVLAFFMFAFSQNTKTIRGELVGISCYVSEGAKDTDCTGASINPGEPIGILEKGSGKLYLVAKDPGRVVPFASKQVEVTGTPHERSGLNVIEIKNIKEIKIGEIPAGDKDKQKPGMVY